MVGAAMHQRFLEEGKPGVTMPLGLELLDVVERRSAHDRLLPEHHRHSDGDDRQPDAERDPVHPAQQLPRGDLPCPIEPQVWHFRQSIDYSVTANYAIFDLASRYRETLLYNNYSWRRTPIGRAARTAGRSAATTSQRRGVARIEQAARGGWRSAVVAVVAAAAVVRRRRRRRRCRAAAAASVAGGARDVELQMHAYNDVLHARTARSARLHHSAPISRTSRRRRSS